MILHLQEGNGFIIYLEEMFFMFHCNCVNTQIPEENKSYFTLKYGFNFTQVNFRKLTDRDLKIIIVITN